MSEFLLEFYVPRASESAAAADGESARLAAEELARRGREIRFCRSIFLPAEETCFVLFEADSAEAVRDAARLANLPPSRISAVSSQPQAATP
jgi:hypothetical protein